MPWTLPEPAIRRVIDGGIRAIQNDQATFNEIFSDYTQGELNIDYGQAYVDLIWAWFSTTKIPVIQSWSFNVQRIPCISVHLANEQEDESKAALLDYVGTDFTDADTTTTGGAASTVMLDLGIHANKGGDHVLWLYYILSHILFHQKLVLHGLGLRLGTFSASDYSKDADKMGNNVWTRWVRYRCTTQNFWDAEPLVTPTEVNTDVQTGFNATDIATSLDVTGTVSTTTSTGVQFGGNPSDPEVSNL
jgi:hypothetical protein